jgi:hypothetical protein
MSFLQLSAVDTVMVDKKLGTINIPSRKVEIDIKSMMNGVKDCGIPDDDVIAIAIFGSAVKQYKTVTYTVPKYVFFGERVIKTRRRATGVPNDIDIMVIARSPVVDRGYIVPRIAGVATRVRSDGYSVWSTCHDCKLHVHPYSLEQFQDLYDGPVQDAMKYGVTVVKDETTDLLDFPRTVDWHYDTENDLHGVIHV